MDAPPAPAIPVGANAPNVSTGPAPSAPIPRAGTARVRTTLQATSCQSEWLTVAEPSQLRLQIVALTLSFVVAPSRGTEIVARFSFTRLLDASCTAVPVPFDAVNS